MGESKLKQRNIIFTSSEEQTHWIKYWWWCKNMGSLTDFLSVSFHSYSTVQFWWCLLEWNTYTIYGSVTLCLFLCGHGEKYKYPHCGRAGSRQNWERQHWNTHRNVSRWCSTPENGEDLRVQMWKGLWKTLLGDKNTIGRTRSKV